MKQKIKIVSSIVTFVLIGFSSIAQDYNYQFQQSTQTYASIVDSTKKVIPQFDEVVKLPIGFSFNYAGKIVDSLDLRSTGLLLFDNENKFNFAFLNKEFLKDIETENLLSSISYDVEIDTYGRHILKIEFKNVMLVRGEEKIHLNFQVWLHQFTNVIDFRMGSVQGTMPSENYLMGLINMNNTNVASVGYLLQQSSETVSGVLIPAQGNLTELSALPAEGTVYTFSPASN